MYTDGCKRFKNQFKFVGAGIAMPYYGYYEGLHLQWTGTSTNSQYLTNNMAELYAIVRALEFLKTNVTLLHRDKLHTIVIHTDSQYSI